MSRVAGAIADETRTRGIRDVLSPVIDVADDVIANVGEGGRDSYPIEHSERNLIERYFPPFVATLRAGARSIVLLKNDGGQINGGRVLRPGPPLLRALMMAPRDLSELKRGGPLNPRVVR